MPNREENSGQNGAKRSVSAQEVSNQSPLWETSTHSVLKNGESKSGNGRRKRVQHGHITKGLLSLVKDWTSR